LGAAPRAGTDTEVVDSRLTAEVERLKPINAELAAFEPEIREQVFKRLLAVQAGRGRLLPRAVLAGIAAGALAALVAGSWHERDAAAWGKSWHWLQRGWGSPWVFMAILALIAGVAAGLVTSGVSPVGKVPGKLVLIAAGITGITGATLALYPNLGPSTQNSFAVKDVQVERNVSLAQYIDQPYVANVLRRDNAENWRFPPPNDPRARTLGIVVDFNFQEQGLRRQDVGLRWVVFNARTSERVAESGSATDEWCAYLVHPHASPCLAFKGELKDLDINSFGFWLAPQALAKTDKRVKCLFVRIEAYTPVKGRLSYADSPVFSGKPGVKNACGGGAKSST
jgi:hypothetical protein